MLLRACDQAMDAINLKISKIGADWQTASVTG
jgi:hypothetical protein